MNLAALILALILVESNGNPNAVGDKGKAIGILQIHECVVCDVNSWSNKNRFVWPTDCYDPDKSRLICKLYLEHYTARTSSPSMETAARIWNGGPLGYKKVSTEAYWVKVKSKLPPPSR